MNENIDLTKILEGCPKGTKFYHKVYGIVNLVYIDTDIDCECPIRLSLYDDDIANTSLTKYGTWTNEFDGECLLVPSKEQQDWSKFERFWDKPKIERFDPKTFQPFDKILVRDDDNTIWNANLFSNINNNYVKYKINSISTAHCYAIPYNDETKHLIGTADDCPEYYKWWEK